MSSIIPEALVLTADSKLVIYRAETHSIFKDWFDLTPWAKGASKTTYCLPSWNKLSQKSKAWNHYDQLVHCESGECFVQCKLCNLRMSHPATKNRGGTSALSSHLISKRCIQNRAVLDTSFEVELDDNYEVPGVPRDFIQYSKDAFEHQILRAIVSCNLSFRSLESDEIQKLFRMLKHNVEIPSIKKIRDKLSAQQLENELKLKALLDSRSKVSIALDAWTSPNKLAFLGIECYWIDSKWRFQSNLIGFEELSGSHTGANFAGVVTRVLNLYGLSNRLGICVTDNAGNNQTMSTEIGTALKSSQNLIWDNQSYHIPCLAHVIQLVVTTFLEKIKATAVDDHLITTIDYEEINEAIATQKGFYRTLHIVRTLAKAINSSPQRLESFKALQVNKEAIPVGMIQDVRTRWNSSILMLQRAKRVKVYIKEWLQLPGHGSLVMLYPTASEWKQIDYVISILNPFNKFTLLLSRTKDISIHLAWRLYNQLFKHIEYQRARLRRKTIQWKQDIYEALGPARDKLAKYYSKTSGKRGLVYNLAAILNPNVRLTVYDAAEWGVEEKSSKPFKAQYREQFLQYWVKHYRGRAIQEAPVQSLQSASRQLPPQSIEDELDLLSQSLKPIDAPPVDNRYNEAVRYLDDPITQKEDVLDWWKRNESKYPTVALMAKDILAAPIAGVGIERIFSHARDVLPYRRNRLKGSSIREIMLCRDFWQKSDILDSDDTEDLNRVSTPNDLADGKASDSCLISDDEEEDNLIPDDEDYNSADERQPLPSSRQYAETRGSKRARDGDLDIRTYSKRTRATNNSQ